MITLALLLCVMKKRAFKAHHDIFCYEEMLSISYDCLFFLKGVSSPKNKNSITHPFVVPNLYELLSFVVLN